MLGHPRSGDRTALGSGRRHPVELRSHDTGERGTGKPVRGTEAGEGETGGSPSFWACWILCCLSMCLYLVKTFFSCVLTYALYAICITFFKNLFILFIFGCVGSLLLPVGFL